MLLDLKVAGKSLSIKIENPRRPDLGSIFSDMDLFIEANTIDMAGQDLKGLVPRMIRGVAGCESGCPADAKDLVTRGYGGAELEYVEGGILSARLKLNDGRFVSLKLFPDF